MFLDNIFGDDITVIDDFALRSTDNSYLGERRGIEARYYGLPIFKVDILTSDIIQNAPCKCFIYEECTGSLYHKHPDGHVSGEFATSTVLERVNEIGRLLDDVEYQLNRRKNRFMHSFKYNPDPTECELIDDVGGALDEFLKEFEVIKVE